MSRRVGLFQVGLERSSSFCSGRNGDVRIENITLKRGVRGLAMKWNFFEPEQKRVPMNQRNDAQRDEGIFQRKPRESCVRQRNAFSGQRTQQDFFRGLRSALF